MFIRNIFNKIRNFLRSFWLNCFYRFLLYPLLSIVQRNIDIQFLNLGFEEDAPNKISESASVALSNFADSIEGRALRAHSLLYERTLAQFPFYAQMDGYRLLEVGCGLGGGLGWIQRIHPELDSLVGIDLHPAPNKCLPPNISIMTASAQFLPFPANSFDILLNVESSHCYGEDGERKFINEVQRVLKVGGYFCWADIRRSQNDINRTLALAWNVGMEMCSLERVNEQILRGMLQTSTRYEALLDKAPWWIRIFKQSLRAAFSPGQSGFEKLKSGEHIYLIGCWKKK